MGTVKISRIALTILIVVVLSKLAVLKVTAGGHLTMLKLVGGPVISISGL